MYHAHFLNDFRQGKFENALRHAERFNMPALFWDGMDRAAALGKLGRIEEGRKALDEALQSRPELTKNPRRFAQCYIMQDRLLDEYLDGLYRAGLPRD